jgi:hypothetical protein
LHFLVRKAKLIQQKLLLLLYPNHLRANEPVAISVMSQIWNFFKRNQNFCGCSHL